MDGFGVLKVAGEGRNNFDGGFWLRKEQFFDFAEDIDDLVVDALPYFDSDDELFPDVDVVFASDEDSFKLGDELIDMCDNKGGEELVEFEVFEGLAFFLDEDFVVDDFNHAVGKLLGVLLAAEVQQNF